MLDLAGKILHMVSVNFSKVTKNVIEGIAAFVYQMGIMVMVNAFFADEFVIILAKIICLKSRMESAENSFTHFIFADFFE